MSSPDGPTNPVGFVCPGIDFLGIPMLSCTTADFIRQFIQATNSRKPTAPLFVTYVNAACSNIAARTPSYLEILRQADGVYADGQAIVWASHYLGTPLPERVNAADFILDFCREAKRNGLRLFFLGSEPGVAASAASAIGQATGAVIAGTADGFFRDDADAVHAVRDSQADILLVGMGVPRQEEYSVKHLGEFGVRAVWCVGAMFEYYGGARARAPVWVRRVGLEWLFRLALEPRRLWRRYIIGNVEFIRRVMKARRAGSKRFRL